jgi:methyltransferase (TIGR00027 family)
MSWFRHVNGTVVWRRMPDLSSSVRIGRIRYIQSLHESAERRNPDTLVKRFFPLRERLRLRWLPRTDLAHLRSDPFYYYLIARTRHYDRVFCEAVADGVRLILNVGCGTDTRSHRFEPLLQAKNVAVVECDQREAILVKERLAGQWRGFNRVEYLPIDLNDAEWPAVANRLAHSGKNTLVMMEGVSPYVDDHAFWRFLEFLTATLPPGSQVAYDFKFRGIDDEFGKGDRTRQPFRLPAGRDEIAAVHQARGLRLDAFESSADLSLRLLPRVGDAYDAVFSEDGLVRLVVNSRKETATMSTAVTGYQ